MTSLRSFIREALIREEISLDLFGKPGVDKTKIKSLKAAGKEIGKTTKDAFDRIGKMTAVLGGQRSSGSGIFSRVLKVGKIASGNPLLRAVGVGSLGYGVYKLYQALTGDTNTAPGDLGDKDAQQYAEMMGQFHDDVVEIISGNRRDLVLESRSDKVIAATDDTSLQELPGECIENYNLILTKIKESNDYDLFMGNFPVYSENVKPGIDAKINEIVTESKQGETGNIKRHLEDWAYVVLLADYVAKTYYYAVDEDVQKIVSLGATSAQVVYLENELDKIETAVLADEEVKNANAAVSEMYEED